MKTLFVAAGSLPVIVASLPAWAQSASDWHHGWDWSWGHMIFGSVMMALFWGGAILLIALAVRWLGGIGRRSEADAQKQDALEVLRDRFARGEIDKDEYESRRRLLSH